MKLFWKRKVEFFAPMSPDEIRSALCTLNVEVLEENFALVKSIYDKEGSRTSSLDSKGASLFAPLGILITVPMLELGFLFDPKYAHLISRESLRIFLIPILAAIGSAAVAAVYLFLSVLVSDLFRAPADKDLFGSIHHHDDFDENQHPGENSKKSAHRYRAYLIDHYWQLYRAAFKANDRKAKRLKGSQVFMFLAVILIVGSVWGIGITSLYMTNSERPNSKPTVPVKTLERPTPAQPASGGEMVKNSLTARPEPITPATKTSPLQLTEPSKMPPKLQKD